MCTWTGCGVEMGSKVQSVFQISHWVVSSEEAASRRGRSTLEDRRSGSNWDDETADCCVQGRARSEGYRWVRRATKRTRRLAKSSRFGTRTGSIQEQTGSDIPAEGGVGGSPAYLYLGATSCRHMAGRAETSGMVVPGGKLHVLSVPSLAMAGRAPAGIHHARRPQPERHGSHPGAVGPVLADRGPWRGIV